jgi:hypothetical protein
VTLAEFIGVVVGGIPVRRAVPIEFGEPGIIGIIDKRRTAFGERNGFHGGNSLKGNQNEADRLVIYRREGDIIGEVMLFLL